MKSSFNHFHVFPLFLSFAVNAVDIVAVEGRGIKLPCPLEAPITDVYMVLWFRDFAGGIPLYRFVIRRATDSFACVHNF